MTPSPIYTPSGPVLVTGGTGFVGAAVVRHLLSQGCTVRALVRPGSDRRNLDGLQVTLVEGRLEDAASLAKAVAGCAALFHVAADYRLWARHPEDMLRINVDGTTSLMRAALAAGVERIVYTSSVATLGIPKDGSPGTETTPVTEADVIGVYKRSKFLAEEAVRALVRAEGLPAVIVNPSTPIGPRDIKPTPTGRMIVEAASGRMPAFVDTGLNLVHVDDVAAGHWLALQRGRVGERYVLGGQDLSLAAILADIADIVGRKAPTVKLPRLGLMPLAFVVETAARVFPFTPFITMDSLRMAGHKMFFSSAKAWDELGFSARPAHGALKDAVDWFRAEGYVR